MVVRKALQSLWHEEFAFDQKISKVDIIAAAKNAIREIGKRNCFGLQEGCSLSIVCRTCLAGSGRGISAAALRRHAIVCHSRQKDHDTSRRHAIGSQDSRRTYIYM